MKCWNMSYFVKIPAGKLKKFHLTWRSEFSSLFFLSTSIRFDFSFPDQTAQCQCYMN